MNIKERDFFAAANSSNGFKSYYDRIFRNGDVDYLYIIKGGSGTGKSRMMHDLADVALKNNDTVEYFYCSSDPKSLDGVIFKNKRIAVIDGTAPHTVDPKLPGCIDGILDVGRFLNSKKLIENKKTIEKIVSEKSRLYDIAYSYLSCAGEADKICDKITAKAFDYVKAGIWADRFLNSFKSSENCSENVRICSSISYMGKLRHSTFETLADRIYRIIPKSGAEYLLIRTLYDHAKKYSLRMTVSYTPLDDNKIDLIYFEDDGVCVTVSDENTEKDYIRVNTERFCDKEMHRQYKNRLKCLSKIREEQINSAIEVMKEIFELHLELEVIYSSAMDFDAKEKYTVEIAERIFGK